MKQIIRSLCKAALTALLVAAVAVPSFSQTAKVTVIKADNSSKDKVVTDGTTCKASFLLTEFFDVVSKLNNTTIEPTIDNIVQYLTDITMLKRCGKTTIGEIITFFKSKGYNDVVNNWMLQVISAGLVDTQQKWVKKISESRISPNVQVFR